MNPLTTRKMSMKNMGKLATLVLALGLLATSCGNVFHNGTEMAISQIKIVGLPSTYSGVDMVFSFEGGGGNGKWVHDVPTLFDGNTYKATVGADGSWTKVLGSVLIHSSATLKFILVDEGKNWDTFQIDKKHSGRKGGDVILDNTWTGAGSPKVLVGTVKGEDVNWTFE